MEIHRTGQEMETHTTKTAQLVLNVSPITPFQNLDGQLEAVTTTSLVRYLVVANGQHITVQVHPTGRQTMVTTVINHVQHAVSGQLHKDTRTVHTIIHLAYITTNIVRLVVDGMVLMSLPTTKVHGLPTELLVDKSVHTVVEQHTHTQLLRAVMVLTLLNTG